MIFENPIKTKRVRTGVTAYQYANGMVEIAGQRYFLYSLTAAINKFRKQFKARR